MDTPRVRIIDGEGYAVEHDVNMAFQNAWAAHENVKIIGYNFQVANERENGTLPLGQHGVLLLITKKE